MPPHRENQPRQPSILKKPLCYISVITNIESVITRMRTILIPEMLAKGEQLLAVRYEDETERESVCADLRIALGFWIVLHHLVVDRV